MMMNEIEARKAEIKTEIESSEMTEERLAELETEVSNLEAEERAIKEEAEARSLAEAEVIAETKTEEILPNNEMKEVRAMYEVNSVEYRNAWVHGLQGRQTEEERVYASNDANTAIPTLVADVFFEKMKKLAPMLSEITLMQVAGNLKFIAEGTRNDAKKHTQGYSESLAGDTIVEVQLGAIEFFKVIGISKSAANMSVDAFIGWLTEMLAGDIARQIDNYIINDATNGFIAAITFQTGTNQILNTAGVTYDNIMDLIALLPAAYDAEAKFLCNKKTLMAVKKIKTTSNDPIFDPAEKTLCGYPVLVDDYVPSTNGGLYLGKWTDIVGNLSSPVEVESDASSGFRSGTIDFRGFAAFDSKLAKKDAIVRFVTTA